MKTYTKVALVLLIANEVRGVIVVGWLLWSVGWHNLSSILLRVGG
jgi:hypothetical protein